jgi:drug/metabolite transporter (DMT)-like permease
MAAVGPAIPAPRSWAGPLLVGLVILAWASAFPGVRAVSGTLTPESIACTRSWVAALALALAAVVIRPPLPAWRDLPALSAVGVLGVFAYNLAFNLGIRTVPAGTTAFVVNGSIVLGMALVGAWWFRERVPMVRWAALALAVTGLTGISLDGDGRQGGAGIPWLLAAAASWVVGALIQKGLTQRLGAMGLACWSFWIGCLPLVFWLPGSIRDLSAAPAATQWGVIYLGVVPSAAATLVWAMILDRMPASQAAVGVAGIPVAAVAIAWLWLGELPAVASIIGGALILAGVMLNLWPARSAPG